MINLYLYIIEVYIFYCEERKLRTATIGNNIRQTLLCCLKKDDTIKLML